MKPCSKYRKRIGWLAIQGLDAREEQMVQAHLKTCGRCRAYWEEMSSLAGQLGAVETRSDIEAAESFHQSLMRRLQANRARPMLWSLPAAWMRLSLIRWRVAFPVLAAILVLVVALPILLRRPQVVPRTASVPQAQSTAAGQNDLPTISSYQMIANRSLDELDEFMVKQGNRNPPAMPTRSPLAGGLLD